jgi:hypothetical protein
MTVIFVGILFEKIESNSNHKMEEETNTTEDIKKEETKQ